MIIYMSENYFEIFGCKLSTFRPNGKCLTSVLIEIFEIPAHSKQVPTLLKSQIYIMNFGVAENGKSSNFWIHYISTKLPISSLTCWAELTYTASSGVEPISVKSLSLSGEYYALYETYIETFIESDLVKPFISNWLIFVILYCHDWKKKLYFRIWVNTDNKPLKRFPQCAQCKF